MAMGELTCSTPIHIMDVKARHFKTTGFINYSGKVRPYDNGNYLGWVNWTLEIETNEDVQLLIAQYSGEAPNYTESSQMRIIPASDNSRVVKGILDYSYEWSRGSSHASGGGRMQETGSFYEFSGNFSGNIWFALQVNAGGSSGNWTQVPHLTDLFAIPFDGVLSEQPGCIGCNGVAMDKYSEDTTYQINCSTALEVL